MKKMKRLAALFLAVVMVMAMGMTAMAAPETTTTSNIVIVSPTQATDEDGKKIPTTYTAYKIFNVATTTIGVGEDAKEVASYTRPKNNALTEEMIGTANFAELKTLFDVVDNGGADVYYNSKDSITASALETFLGKIYAMSGVALNNPNVDKITYPESNVISNVTPGYYYVRSSVGSKAMLRAVAGESTEITEKNTTSGWGDNGGKRSYRSEIDVNDADKDGDTTDTILVPDSFYAIGETVTYEVTYAAAQNYTTETTKDANTGEDITTTKKVYQYVVNDDMPDGMRLNPDSVVITVTEAAGENRTHTLSNKADKTNIWDEKGLETYDTSDTYVGTISNNGFDIIIPWAESKVAANVEDFNYRNVPAEIKITYTATVTKDVNVGGAITNTVRIAPNEIKNTDTEKRENKIYTGSLDVLKYDDTGITDSSTTEEVAAAKNKKLEGAVFVVAKGTEEKTAEGKTKVTITDYLVRAKDGKEEGKISWSKTITDDVYKLVTDKDGKSKDGPLEGLDKDTYYLVEIQAPEGYNLLADPVKVTIATDENVITENEKILDSKTATDDEKRVAKENIKNALVMVPSVGNKTGTVLPSTGGIGTTIFYVVGGIMVLGAGVLLITKKRMSAK